MAGYTEFQVTEPFISSLPKLLSNDKSALTWNAGTAFPTTGLSVGMPCYRTDEKKIYLYDGSAWRLFIDLNSETVGFKGKADSATNADNATTANSATKATQDGNGQVIASTYATKSALNTGLSGKANTSHTHTKANITDLKVYTGATASANGAEGLVKAPTSGQQAMFLRGDGNWATTPDQSVKQVNTTANAEYPLLAKVNANTSDETRETRFAAGVTVNPSTKTITATTFKGTNLSGKLPWTDLTNVPTNVTNAVSFVEGQTLTPQQAQIVRLKILTAYQTSNTGSLILPNGTIAQRDATPTKGAIRFNSEKGWFEGYTGSEWVALVTDPSGKNLPTGTCLCGLFKEAPDLFLSLDGSRINKSDYYDLCNLLWGFSSFRGDGSTYAVLPNMHHRFFEGTTSISEVATYVEAGLPNISGVLKRGSGVQPFAGPEGAFYFGANEAYYSSQNNPGSHSNLFFDASRFNKIYGKSSEVQTNSLKMLSLVRT